MSSGNRALKGNVLYRPLGFKNMSALQFQFSYKKKVREYQTDFEQQKSINDLKKTKEEEAMQKINLIP